MNLYLKFGKINSSFWAFIMFFDNILLHHLKEYTWYKNIKA